MVPRAVHSRCSVNHAYLFSMQCFSITRPYDLPQRISHNSSVGTFCPSPVGLSIPDILLSDSCCWALLHAASTSWDAISQISTIPFFKTVFKNIDLFIWLHWGHITCLPLELNPCLSWEEKLLVQSVIQSPNFLQEYRTAGSSSQPLQMLLQRFESKTVSPEV